MDYVSEFVYLQLHDIVVHVARDWNELAKKASQSYSKLKSL